MKAASTNSAWPALPLGEWSDTYGTLHMWLQIVGKTRLALAPMQNHWWQVPLYVTPRGLTTSAIPYGNRTFAVDVDFIDHALSIRASDGATRGFPLVPRAVADFYAAYLAALRSLGIEVAMRRRAPVEVEIAIPFAEDRTHTSYDADAAHRCWQVLVQTDRVLKRFRGRFLGKASPVHFFWGSFDLAATRFSGRRAPERPDADFITKEAYSHEVISHGFWPGDGEVVKDAAFYAYAIPELAGFREQRVMPSKAFYSGEKNEFFLMYNDVRLAQSPEQALLEFCQSTYEAGANLANWDRANLERPAASTHA